MRSCVEQGIGVDVASREELVKALAGGIKGELIGATGPEKTAGLLTLALQHLCDGREKYLDTVFNDEWMQSNGLLSDAVIGELDGLLRGNKVQSHEPEPAQRRQYAM